MSRGIPKPLALLFLASPFCLQPTTSQADMLVAKGNRPVTNRGWPTGTEAVANLPSRLGYMEGPLGGECCFKFHCQSTLQFSRALEKFGAIRVPRTARLLSSSDGLQTVRGMDRGPLLLVVHDRPKRRSSPYGIDFGKRIDWTFTVWAPEHFHRLFSHPEVKLFSTSPNYRQPVPPPRINVYVGEGGPIEWDEVSVPPKVRVIDRRRSATKSADSGGVVRGSVYSMATHQVIAGAEVTLSKRVERRRFEDVRQVVTDAAGAFEMTAIGEGDYQVYVRKDGYAGRLVADFDNDTGHACLDLDTLLSREVSLKGTVTDEEGHPINGVEVRASTALGINGLGYQCAEWPRAVSDERGRFQLGPLPEGFVAVGGRSQGMYQVRIEPDRPLFELTTKPWTERKDKEIRIIMGGTGGVYGRVLGTDGLPPTRRFIVELAPEGRPLHQPGSWGGSMQCQKDGQFEFDGMRPGKYELVAKPNPGSRKEAITPQKITIEAGTARQVEIRSPHAR